MIVLVGASASGKTELAKILYQKYNYHKVVTTTTRLPRTGEKNHVDYHFLTIDEFKKLESKNGFIEVSLYNNHWYGIQKNDVDIQGVVIVEPNGANTLIEQIGNDAYVVYVEASEKIRMNRMLQRGDQLSKVHERIRFDQGVFIINQFKKIDLRLSNESESLDHLAKLIDNNYKDYVSQQSKEKALI
jgi:guanylate kinase